MKRFVSLAVFFVVAMATQAQAQITSTMDYPTDNAAKGFRVSFLKPVLELEVEFTVKNSSNKKTSDSEKIDNTNGFAIGFANLPVQQVGYTGQLSLLRVSKQGGMKNEPEFLRAEGNVAYAISNQLYMQGGLNLTDAISKNTENLDAGIGIQAGGGFQFTSNFGLELNYKVMHMSTEDQNFRFDLYLSGVELALTGTF